MADITYRIPKGSALTHVELDDNFISLADDVDANAVAIGTNATNIGTNATDIGTNATDIGTNATNIGTNATNIGTNVTNIGTNASDITNLEGRMTAEELATAAGLERFGWVTVSDDGGSQTLTTANTFYQLEIDGLGAQTDLTHGVATHKNIWNTTTSQLEFDDLSIGDRVQFRLNYTVEAGVNSEFACRVDFAIGAFTPDVPLFSLFVDHSSFKSAGTKAFNIEFSVVIQNSFVRDFPTEVMLASDSNGDTVNVEGIVITSFIR